LAAKVNILHHHIGSSVIWLDETDSTNRVAKQMAEETSCKDGTIICAHYQQAGRGQGANVWESEKGKNLTLSVVLFPHALTIQEHLRVNLIMSLAVYDFISAIHPEDIFIKWPNDIYAGGKKICGLLIENSLQGELIRQSICGVGININQTEFINSNATSLKQLTKQNYQLESILASFILHLQKRINSMYTQDMNKLIGCYEEVLYRKGLATSFMVNQSPLQATPIGITAEGLLRMQTQDSLIQIRHNEVKWLQ
jgi:BirA family biotin operon repressor/biotin-[acetyl-CoA-carboxylase] ligase